MLSQVLTRKEQLVLIFFGASICLGSIVLYWVTSKSEAESAVESASAPDAAFENALAEEPTPTRVVEQHTPAAADIHVSVAGAVRSPGVYTFENGKRVQDAIDAARGTLEGADLSDINLAAHLIDGTTLTVPGEHADQRDGVPLIRRPLPTPPNPAQYTISGWQPRQDTTTGAQTVGPSTASPGTMNLNSATQTELETLPGIGPKLAAEIIRFREQHAFQTVDDLELVSGIGPKRLESIRGLVTVQH